MYFFEFPNVPLLNDSCNSFAFDSLLYLQERVHTIHKVHTFFSIYRTNFHCLLQIS